MSVSLTITHKNGQSENFPIATEDFFAKEWEPLIEKLNLKYLPLFRTGFPVKSDDLPEIISELQILLGTIKNDPTEIKNQMRERIDLTIKKLSELENEDEVFIG